MRRIADIKSQTYLPGPRLPYITVIYDDTFEGFLSAVAFCYREGLESVRIVPETRHEPEMFSGERYVEYDPEWTERLWNGLRRYLSEQALRNLYATFLGESDKREGIMLDFIRKTFNTRGEIEENLIDESVREVARWGKLLYRERHRHEAFVRFHQNQQGEYYALIEPDFNVLPLILPHFRDRYQDQRWTIYDVRRCYGIQWDLQAVQEVQLGQASREEVRAYFDEDPSEKEELYQQLWKEYFHSTGIPSRRNMKLHLRHMPGRYWKYLVEKW